MSWLALTMPARVLMRPIHSAKRQRRVRAAASRVERTASIASSAPSIRSHLVASPPGRAIRRRGPASCPLPATGREELLHRLVSVASPW